MPLSLNRFAKDYHENLESSRESDVEKEYKTMAKGLNMDPESEEEGSADNRGKIDLDADDEQDVHIELKNPVLPKPKFKKVLLPTAD